MTWVEDMRKDAVSLAFPELELQEDDRIRFDVVFDDGYDPTYSDGPSHMIIKVEVDRDENYYLKSRSFYDDEATSFWADLMRKGSERYGTN